MQALANGINKNVHNNNYTNVKRVFVKKIIYKEWKFFLWRHAAVFPLFCNILMCIPYRRSMPLDRGRVVSYLQRVIMQFCRVCVQLIYLYRGRSRQKCEMKDERKLYHYKLRPQKKEDRCISSISIPGYLSDQAAVFQIKLNFRYGLRQDMDGKLPF